jgi:hypothetical protein
VAVDRALVQVAAGLERDGQRRRLVRLDQFRLVTRNREVVVGRGRVRDDELHLPVRDRLPREYEQEVLRLDTDDGRRLRIGAGTPRSCDRECRRDDHDAGNEPSDELCVHGTSSAVSDRVPES